MPNLINVSNRLPVTLEEGKVKKSSGGLVSALEGLAGERYTLKRVGWPGNSADDPEQRKELDRMLRDEFGFVPIFLSEDEVDAFYQGFSNSSLWPLLHNMPSKFQYARSWWEHYQAVNERFADAVLEIAQDGDLVWIHDYHLLLLPGMLKAKRPGLKIGFFLHTPFPPAEIFRCHPRRRELLSGMLGADQLGFHTFPYLRNFRSAVLRLLGVESDITRIAREGHLSHLGVYPIGIHAPKFIETMKSPEFEKETAELRKSHDGKRIVFSVERLDYTKGILRRLDAIEMFLDQSPNRDDIRFIFVNVPSREDVDEYKSLREEVEFRVGRLNGKFSTLHNTPVHFIHGSVDFTRLCAMYAVAEVALVTPLIDGMNLVAKEYVICQQKKPGVLILSEFAGAAEELFNAMLVNPYDPEGVAHALTAALEAGPMQRAEWMAPMIERVTTCDAAWWAGSFVKDLESRPAMLQQPASDPARVNAARDRIQQALAEGKSVGLFLDYDGTLREIERDPAAARPTPAVRQVLERLAAVPNLDLTVVTGRRAVEIEKWLGDLPLTLVAEHGADLRVKGSPDWQQLDRHASYSWKPDVLKVLRLYADSTPGTFVEQKRTGLVWHYRKADPEFGAWKANQLAAELSSLLANEPVLIRHGKKIIEIVATQMSKGAAVADLIEKNHYALSLIAGDDQTDESMFELKLPNLITIKIGWGETAAQLRIAQPSQFRKFLVELIPTRVASVTGG